MKLWYAFMFEKEDSSIDQDAVFLVRAPDPLVCTKLVESWKAGLPSYINPFVTGIIEMGEDPHSDIPMLLSGPLLGTTYYQDHAMNTYWRRDSPNEYWVNFTKFDQGAPLEECILDEDAVVLNINSEEDVLNAANSILYGSFDNDLEQLGEQLDLCLKYLDNNSLLEQYERDKLHPFYRALDYLTNQLAKKAEEINAELDKGL